MKRTVPCLLAIATLNCAAQDLVLNGDFEQYSGCPTAFTQIDSALFWTAPTTVNSTDYFNACAPGIISVPHNNAGYQLARSGVGYGGIAIYSTSDQREYLEGTLAVPLTAGACYRFGMYVNLANTSRYTTDAIGIYFLNTLEENIGFSTPLPFTPQIENEAGNEPDSVGWMEVAANYAAQGGERYFIIGNFHDNANTTITTVNTIGSAFAYILVDDVSLSPCTGVGELDATRTALAWPNPVNALLELRDAAVIQDIWITDAQGRLVMHSTPPDRAYTVQVHVGSLPGGLYTVHLRTAAGDRTARFIKD